jgi:hypothetical protein
MDREYINDVDTVATSYPELASDLRGLDTLEDVFRWLRQPGAPAVGVVDTVALDEFSHDLILELTDSQLYLVFGAT